MIKESLNDKEDKISKSIKKNIQEYTSIQQDNQEKPNTNEHTSSNMIFPEIEQVNDVIRRSDNEETPVLEEVETGLQETRVYKTRRNMQLINEDENMNTPWGDCPSLKCDNECRLVLQNVNGLGSSYNCAKATSLAYETDSIGADVIGMVETNTYWKHNNILETTTNAWRKYFDQTKIVTSSSDVHFNSVYQPGGTMMVVGSPWSSRTSTKRDISGLGRWTEAVITGRNIEKWQ